MKFAGRCIAGRMRTPAAVRAGVTSASAASRLRVVCKVLAPYWLDSVISTPGRPMISASPCRGAAASTTCATSPTRTVPPLPVESTESAIWRAVIALGPGSIRMRWLGVSAKPPPLTWMARSTAPARSAKVRLRASRRAGSARTSIRRCSPPNTFARATPGAASRRGRTVHSTRSRSAMGLRRSLVKPILSRSMVEEVSGVMRGVSDPAGNCGMASASASDTCCRAR